MKSRFRRRSSIAGVVLAALLCAGPAAAETPGRGHSDAEAGRVPLQIRRGAQILLDGEVNGRPARIWLDSGVSHLILDTGFADAAGLRKRGRVPVRGHDASVDRRGTANVRIGDVRLRADEVVSFDIASRFGPIGGGIDAVIGRDLLEGRIVDLDLPGRTIAFHDRAGFAAPAGAVALPLRRAGRLRSIPVSLGGQAPVPALFDLGANDAIKVAAEYAEETGLLRERRTSTVPVLDFRGITIQRIATIGPVIFGTSVFHSVPVTVAENGWHGLSALIGLDVLSRFRLVSDYDNDRLWIIPGASDPERPFRRDRSGIRPMPEGDRLRVIHVSGGSPAEAAGWREGDVIVAVNGEPVRTDGEQDWGLWAQGAPGTVVRFTMADGSGRSLTLADYY